VWAVVAILALPWPSCAWADARLAWISELETGSEPVPSAERPILEAAPVPGQSLLALGPYLEVFEDRSRTLNEIGPVAASAEFRPVLDTSFNLGMADSVWWFRFTLRLDPGTDWHFDPDWAYVRTLDFFSPLPRPGPDGSLWQRTPTASAPPPRGGSSRSSPTGRAIPIISGCSANA
jgi:hypothetical protein